MVDYLRDIGKHFTVNQMVAKESVKARFERPDQGISYTEFSYMLLQAFDYLELFRRHDCRLQVGGSDQWATSPWASISSASGAGRGLRTHDAARD